MLTEKQLFELIKALQSSNFSTTEVMGLCFAVVIAALIMSYIVSLITEKAKISATNANYEILREQLSLNTKTIKDIESKITSELWISQQLWQKKYEMYEYIYTQLLSIKKWADNEFEVIELHMLPTYMANNYHGYFTKEQEDQFWNEVQQAHDDREKALNDEEFKLKNKELQQKLGVAFTALTEMMITKAILLNKNVTVILNELIENIGTDPSPLDYEEPDDYGYRVKDAIDTALEKIRCSALSDLEIRHLEK
ncbi:hypothetical protein KZ666_15455 [Klebsiella pneumoniae]|uniref:hypothetical protein n=1 Tax=Klebsiella pneumoniae TaxID=573 RepID=UPI0009081BBA|nr:hypothetical protein [Klebsiella pneumoniae]UAA07811.1 hypothetical protein KZ666_15455 [Klebsiella pneumoniae]HBV3338839.1 hypothetical protein [Klebsiella pneumoniae]HCJ1710103.1 hypothetical protein [Klebsiella pneumoniae]HCJ1713844.1 hypothetical protein [Klebsiella pneumoniae]